MAATQKDIAKLLGVSVNTVSRALKNMPDIGKDTCKRVQDAAVALEYRPNLNARSLVLRKSSSIGVAINESDNPVRMEFCEKFRAIAAQHGYCTITISLDLDNPAQLYNAIQELLSRGIDALVIGALGGILAEQPLGKILIDCHNNHTPVVAFGTPQTSVADTIYIDFAQSAATVTSYLLQQKRSPIAFSRDPAGDARAAGYSQVMRQHGLEPTVFSITGHRLTDGALAIQQYLATYKNPPNAIIAPNDLVAIGVISELRKHNWRVPQDCAVVGFDNTEFGAYITPTLTSIGFDNNLFANTVWDLIKQRLNSPDTPPENITLTQTLVPRDST